MKKLLSIGLALIIATALVVSCDDGKSSGGSSSLPQLSGTLSISMVDNSKLFYPDTRTITGSTDGTEDGIVYEWQYVASTAAAAPTTGWNAAIGENDTLASYTADRGGWYRLSGTLAGYATKYSDAVYILSDLTPQVQSVLESESAPVERVALEKDAFVIYKFTIPAGKSWSDYSGITVQYLMDDNNVGREAAATRLYGPYTDTTSTDKDFYGSGAGKFTHGTTTYDTLGELTVVPYTDFKSWEEFSDTVNPYVEKTMIVARKDSGDNQEKTKNNRFHTYIWDNGAAVNKVANSWFTVSYNIKGATANEGNAHGAFNSQPGSNETDGILFDGAWVRADDTALSTALTTAGWADFDAFVTETTAAGFDPDEDWDATDDAAKIALYARIKYKNGDGLGNMTDGTYGNFLPQPFSADTDIWVGIGISGSSSGGITQGLTAPAAAVEQWIKNVTLVGAGTTENIVSTGSGLAMPAFVAYINPIPGAYRSDVADTTANQNKAAMSAIVWPHSTDWEPKDPSAVTPTQTITVTDGVLAQIGSNSADFVVNDTDKTVTVTGTAAASTYTNEGFTWSLPATNPLVEGANEFVMTDYDSIKVTWQLTATDEAFGGAAFNGKGNAGGNAGAGSSLGNNWNIYDADKETDQTITIKPIPGDIVSIGFQFNAWSGDSHFTMTALPNFTVKIIKVEFIPAE